MALKKSVEINQTGVMADYIKIADIRTSIKNNLIKVRVDFYLNAESRAAGKDPILYQDFSMPLEGLELQSTNIVEAMYLELKRLELLDGAIDA